ncbi:hypothetical protein [Pseudoroseicyclus sp. CXY001]|uniref:hypothetical protein n=1 Tax=Pseudoroseicyclus sp. CXY001 TaxID=3242492 RepID=UPI00358DC8F5
MSWARIRGLSRDASLAEGLEARLADPLWMLARQRAFGALQGEDAASPISVEIAAESAPVDEMSIGKADPVRLDADTPPVEPFLEAEPIHLTPGWHRARIEAAFDLLSRLPAGGRAAFTDWLRESYPLAPAPSGDAATGRLAPRAFDAAALHAALTDDRKAIETAAGEIFGKASGVMATLDAWAGAQNARIVAPKAGGAWVAGRFAYEATLRASSVEAELTAERYRGGEFDWMSVDLASPSGAAFAPGKGAAVEPLVSRLRYPGQPARRFWSIEDGRVNFGGMELGLTALPQLLLVEFATVHSDDWYLAPLTLPSGALSRVTSVTARDVFGERRAIEAAAVKDARAEGAGRGWRFFELAGDLSPEQGAAPWLYLPRVVASRQEGRPVEEVILKRDEAANLAWGIETKIESPAARPHDRAAAWARMRAATRAAAAAAAEAAGLPPAEADAWLYLMETETPPHWIPFLPQLDKASLPTGQLARARLSLWERWPEELAAEAGPRSEVLDPGGPFAFDEGALPREGLQVTRSYQAARGPDGRLLLWVGRQARPAPRPPVSTREVDLLVDASGQPLDGSEQRGPGGPGGGLGTGLGGPLVQGGLGLRERRR